MCCCRGSNFKTSSYTGLSVVSAVTPSVRPSRTGLGTELGTAHGTAVCARVGARARESGQDRRRQSGLPLHQGRAKRPVFEFQIIIDHNPWRLSFKDCASPSTYMNSYINPDDQLCHPMTSVSSTVTLSTRFLELRLCSLELPLTSDFVLLEVSCFPFRDLRVVLCLILCARSLPTGARQPWHSHLKQCLSRGVYADRLPHGCWRRGAWRLAPLRRRRSRWCRCRSLPHLRWRRWQGGASLPSGWRCGGAVWLGACSGEILGVRAVGPRSRWRPACAR